MGLELDELSWVLMINIDIAFGLECSCQSKYLRTV